MLAAIARGLRLNLDERDHLFRLAGHGTPKLATHTEHVSPGKMRILDRLADTPAQVMTDLGETLVQTPAARALFGDETRFPGHARSVVHRWFTDPGARDHYPAEDHAVLSRSFTADARAVLAKQGPGSRAAALVDDLLARSAEFADIWRDHEVRVTHAKHKRLQHPEVGVMDLACQVMVDPATGHALLVLTAAPGTESYEKLALLSVLGPLGRA